MEAEKQFESPKEIPPKERAKLARRLRAVQRVYFSHAQEGQASTILKKPELVKISARANRILRDNGGRAIIIFDQSEEGIKIHYLEGKKYIQTSRSREKFPVVIEEYLESYNWVKLRKQNGLPALDIHTEHTCFTIVPKPDQSGTHELSIAVLDPKKAAPERFETIFEYHQNIV